MEIHPSGDVVRIEGKNDAGKSSVIGAIWAALGGKDEMGTNPLRDGERKGYSRVDLGDMVVERKFTENGTYLEVRDREGRSIPKPQEFLNRFFTRTSIDPRGFISLSGRERRDLLLDLTGDRDEIEALEQGRRDLYEERTLVNREVKALQGKLAGHRPSLEAESEIPIAALTTDLQRAVEEDNAWSACRHEVEVLEADARVARSELEQYRKVVADYEARIKRTAGVLADVEKRMEAAVAKLGNGHESRVGAIRARIAEAEMVNVRVKGNAEVRGWAADLERKQQEAEKLTESMEAIDARKQEILGKSSIGAVEFDGDVLLVDGIPFDDLSTSRQLKVGLEIGMSQNPALRVLRISDGNVFDSDSMRLVEEFAREHDCQIWIERVADSPQGGVFIEDGVVAAVGTSPGGR